MTSSLQAALLAGAAAAAIALGAIAAHADEASTLRAAQQHATALDAATGGNNLVSKAVKDPDFVDAARKFADSDESKEVVKALMNLLGDVGGE
jgi:hypothetical protein